MTSSRKIPKLHIYIGGRGTPGCVRRKAVVASITSDNWLLSELELGQVWRLSGGGWPVFIVKKLDPAELGLQIIAAILEETLWISLKN